MKYLILFLLTILFGGSCENFPEKFDGILFRNKSSIDLAVYYGFKQTPQGTAYPDTILPLDSSLIRRNIKAQNGSYDFTTQAKLKMLIDDLPSDTLSIYVLSMDTINTYTWEVVRQGNKYIKRFDLSYRDLEEMNFEVIYQ